MTWAQLLELLLSMQAANHTSMDERICIEEGADIFWLDVHESLSTGKVYFTTCIEETEDED